MSIPIIDFFLQRHWGEPVVRFELPVSAVADARRRCRSTGISFAPDSGDKEGDAWVVELPMTEGRTPGLWQVGDATGRGRGGAADSLMSGTRTVRALERVSNAYPGR